MSRRIINFLGGKLSHLYHAGFCADAFRRSLLKDPFIKESTYCFIPRVNHMNAGMKGFIKDGQDRRIYSLEDSSDVVCFDVWQLLCKDIECQDICVYMLLL